MNLSLRSIFEASTVADMAALLRSIDPAGETGRCLVTLARSGSAPPLFCVHGAGGYVAIYGPLSRAMSPRRPCYGLQAAGLERAIAPDRSIQAMAWRYAAEIAQVWPAGHLALAGYSMGGLIALEIARSVTGRAATCVLLDTAPSQLTAEKVSRSQALFFVARTLGLDPRQFIPGIRADTELGQTGREISQDDPGMDARTLDLLTSELLRQGMVPPDSARADVERLVEMYEINSAAMENYEVRPYNGDVVLVVTEMDGVSDEEILRRTGWAGLLENVTVLRAIGDHHTFLAGHSTELVAMLERVLPR